ncbi:hypothetical protein ACFWCQ_21625, partial [Streptomyces cyaneofuscatus]|uniref:hypothetical protein n=1 Tax=Streptomyces cyaneofuscatus TaxID=66883 RepID=UPI003651F6ED
MRDKFELQCDDLLGFKNHPSNEVGFVKPKVRLEGLVQNLERSQQRLAELDVAIDVFHSSLGG